MATINDNSVKWSLESIYNAGQLNGLTAEQIKADVTSKITKVLVVIGTVTFTIVRDGLHTQRNLTQTIPLPSGFERTHCKYYMEIQTASGSSDTSISVSTGNINQGTGVVTATSTGSQSTTLNAYYICFAVK